ncbi:response regulator [Mucilaginibacter sp. McL0603]|uniref:response regulator n=1 Tax=Mucilaginibacter sp. McL0603 TaxID=3415670 RepID=UPI003CEC2A0D
MKKILLVENDPGLNDAVTCVLQSSGFDVIQSRVNQTVEQIHQIDPQLILLNNAMNTRPGDEVCLEIKNHPLTKHIPVILTTLMTKYESVADNTCADDFIIMPFNIADMEQKIRCYI